MCWYVGDDTGCGFVGAAFSQAVSDTCVCVWAREGERVVVYIGCMGV